MAIEEGKAAPAFTLTDAEGKKVSLKDFAGKNVILYFYPKDDTPGCTKEACDFRDNISRVKSAGAVLKLVTPVSGASTRSETVSKLPLSPNREPLSPVMIRLPPSD